MTEKLYTEIKKDLAEGKRLYWVLLDPDDFSLEEGANTVREAETAGANAILVGGSLMHTDHLDSFVSALKEASSLPVILFPGDASQITGNADGILFHSLISGRNPDFLIGEQVKGAPHIKRHNIEPIPTAYMLIESGTVTSVEFMSNTRPIPRDKPGIAALHGLAAQYMGQKLIYLEAGSGAKYSVPEQIIGAVKSQVDIPVIAGGGIRDAKTAAMKLKAGADIIVTGNLLKAEDGLTRMKEIAEEIRNFS
jgi:phosphoglycerol geranylgeranyltransferase